ncbi:MAG: signal peptidase II [Phycisphaerales bacterium]|nr:signal peptidase II [Phycisphaerales bacterium]
MNATPASAESPTPPAPPPPNPAAHELPAWRSGWSWALLLSVSILGLAADLASKSLAFARVAGEPVTIDRADVVQLMSHDRGLETLLPFHAPHVVLPRVLEFQLVLNKGAVFGLGAGKRWLFVVFTALAVAIGLWAFGRWTHARDRLSHLAIGLVLAGGLGNVYDRIVFACVRDFIHPLPGVRLPFGWHWPNDPSGEVWPWVSNVADLFLILGVFGLMLSMWRAPRPEVKPVPAPDASSGQ